MGQLEGRSLDWAITATAGAGFSSTFPEIDTTEGGGGSSSMQGLVVAIYEIGCFLGALGVLAFGESLGRRRCIMLGSAVLAFGGALQASASTIAHMIVGRIVAGLGNGINTSTIPVWHSELMKPESRGKGLCIELAINIFGVMMAYWVDYGMSFEAGEAQFRFPLALQCAFAVATAAGALALPESPRWLVAHDRLDEARRVLCRVDPEAGAGNAEGSAAAVEARSLARLAEIRAAVEEERAAADGTSFRALFRSGDQRFRYRVLLGIGGQFMQQISGINLITYYATVIFEQSVGMPHNTALLLAGFNGVAYWVSACVPIWLVDRLGRRRLMLFAVCGQCACMAVLAGTVADGSKPAGLVATVMLFLFNFFFGVGLLAIPWLLPAEYSPLAIRTKSAALATASNWIFTFLVVMITPVSIASIGWRTYLYFAIFNLLFVPLIWFFYPETQRLSLEQVDKLFTGPKVVLHWHPSMGAVAGESSGGTSELEPGTAAAVAVMEEKLAKVEAVEHT